MEITTEPLRRRPRFRRAEAPSFQLTERDIEIVRQIARLRFLRSTHVSQLLDAPHRKICERLTALYHAGYLDRPHAQLEYHVHGGGSTPLVYALGNHGAKLLKIRGERDHASGDWTRKNRDTGREYLLHTLAIANVCVALTVACRRHGNVTLKHPEQLLASAPDATRALCDQWSLRVRVHYNGTIREIGIQPDYVFALVLPDGRRRPFVVECDRGTMPVERSNIDQSSMLRKFLAYEGIRQQRLYAARYGWENFRVLTTTTSLERVETMLAVINRTPAVKSSPLFLFADHAALIKVDIVTHPWRHASGKTQTLI